MIKIFGIRENLEHLTEGLSDTINSCMVEALKFPENKRAHRFFLLDRKEFYYPEGRSDAYTVIEITMISGRSKEAKKKLIKLLFQKIEEKVGIAPNDIEITISESPACNWGFRGMTGDEAHLNYKIDV